MSEGIINKSYTTSESISISGTKEDDDQLNETKATDDIQIDNQMNQEISTHIEFDDVLRVVGEFGPYQIILFFLTAPFCFLLPCIAFSQVFITLVPDHWCHIPQLNKSGLTQFQRHF